MIIFSRQKKTFFFAFFNEEKFRVTSVKSLKKICVSTNRNWSYLYNAQTWTALIYLPVSTRGAKETEKEKNWINKRKKLLKSPAAAKKPKRQRQKAAEKRHQITDTLLGMGINQSICKQMGWFHFHFMSSWFFIYVIYYFFFRFLPLFDI